MMRCIIYLMATMVLLSCNSVQKDSNSVQKGEPGNTATAEPMAIDMFPNVKKDDIQHVITLPAKDNEQDYKIEFFVTKTMEVDCNHHALQGTLLAKDLKGWGYTYFVFQTNGDIISTMMACPDKTLTKKDVPSSGQLLNYNSKLPVVIYTPKGYKVKYKLLKAIPGEQTTKQSAKTKPLATDMFPRAKKDETQHVITLPAKDNEQEDKVEIFVTKTMKVDCNHHTLQGLLAEKDLQGWGYTYYVFQTNGDVTSTMMACPDKTLTKKEVASQSLLLNYNSKLPVVIYTPKGYKAAYKVWKTLPGEQTAKPTTGKKENRLTLKFDSHNTLNVNNTKVKFTIYGYDSSLADVAATVITEKEVNISETPFTVSFDLPKNPESLIVPKIDKSSRVKYYLSVSTDQKGAANIQLDHEARESGLNLDERSKNDVFYLKAY